MPARDSETLAVGDPAPDFTLPAPDGMLVTRSAYQGSSPLILHFFRGTW
jgi:peroxiredoxin